MSKYGSKFIKSIRPAKYNYVPELESLGIKTSDTHFGVMAQDIQKYLESVSDEEFSIIQRDYEGNLMVNYIELIGPMIKTIQELMERVEQLEKDSI